MKKFKVVRRPETFSLAHIAPPARETVMTSVQDSIMAPSLRQHRLLGRIVRPAQINGQATPSLELQNTGVAQS